MSERMPIVWVDWKDAHSWDEFSDEETMLEKHAPRLVVSVGIQYRRDATGITLLRDYDDQGDGDGLLFIPEGMIIRVRRLKYAR